MSHFAKIENGIVEQVLVVSNEVLLDNNNVEQEALGISFLQNLSNDAGAVWVQTSYNKNFRKNYAGVGFTYDETNNAFYAPQPYLSWTLNNTSWLWEAPIPHPNDSNDYIWNEETLTWENK